MKVPAGWIGIAAVVALLPGEAGARAIEVTGRCDFWEDGVFYPCKDPVDFVGGGGGGPTVHEPGGGRGGSGGGAARPAVTAKEQETDDKQDASPCAGETAGNPVVLYTGNKVEPELDFAAVGEMGLFLQRTYNHHWNGIGLFGKHWLSNFDYSLAFANGTAWAQRPDGRRIKFVAAGTNRWNEEKPQPVAYIVRNSDGTYTLHNEERGTESYSTEGYILERRNEQGVRWTFTYSGKYLLQVTHASGRNVRFGWTNGQLEQVTDPAGNVYRYTHAANVFGSGRGRLASAVPPGTPATTVAYHYEDERFPGGLTGKSYNGARYSRFAYDAQGRAISTEHAGGVNRYTFSYAIEASEQLPLPPPPPAPGGFLNADESRYCIRYSCNQPVAFGALAAEPAQSRPTRLRVTETNPLGRKTTHLYEDGRKVSVTGDASPNCAASYRELTYDANGYPDIIGDFTNQLTDFDYDAHGHLLRQIEAAGTPRARRTMQAWDEATNRLVRVTVEGERDTQYTWMPNGRLALETVIDLTGKGSRRVTAYRYTEHANGLLATMEVDGPLANDTVTSTWGSAGDLLSVRDGMGQLTTYAQHNGLGQPGRITGSNGEVTDIAYDARGRVVATMKHVDGVAQATRVTFTDAGLPASVRTPDGREVRFVYDAALRLVEEYERQPDGLYARQRTAYNVMSQPTAVEVHRTPYPPDTWITGQLEGVFASGAGEFEARGWACTTGQDTHVNVDLYAGAEHPAGTFLGRYAANRTSESAVANACAAFGSAYRFAIPIVDATRDAHGGKSLHVHGMSPAGKENTVIAGSGAHAIPRLPPVVAPTGLSVPAQSGTGGYTVTWSASARATSYRLEESTNGGAWIVVHDGAATSKAVAGKGAGIYRYRVKARNEAGIGPTSSTAQVEVVVPSTPRITYSEREQAGTGKDALVNCSVMWTSVPHASRYELQDPASGQVQYNGASTSLFGSRQQYCAASHVVRACNTVGCSAWSGPPFKQVQTVIGSPTLKGE